MGTLFIGNIYTYTHTDIYYYSLTQDLPILSPHEYMNHKYIDFTINIQFSQFIHLRYVTDNLLEVKGEHHQTLSNAATQNHNFMLSDL